MAYIQEWNCVHGHCGYFVRITVRKYTNPGRYLLANNRSRFSYFGWDDFALLAKTNIMQTGITAQ